MADSLTLPQGWSRCESKSKPGKFFYFNADTGEKSWNPPVQGAGSKRTATEPQQAAGKRLKSAGDSSAECCHALHLLVKHAQSRKPVSWREPNRTITMEKEEARALLTKLRAEIAAAAEKAGGGPAALEDAFRARATQRSDCSSATRGGDLGSFGRGKMQKPFEEGAFALAPQEMSGIVDSNSGLHIIYRIA
eukprot:gnl/TRDRNA2_/TRDRNA2_193472_c0_seq1.p1 gnl/TRDRNA2_/TRDRNA2_193472_c0~~gnl/TRDRNA2_/TRDRNA2_193472_c0_seq1.p1  ORF type:complete len:192 (-),score=47.43 gnl/TRDRNA2_/TRDRNA2_193472_c0_seq1:103-678(-)